MTKKFLSFYTNFLKIHETVNFRISLKLLWYFLYYCKIDTFMLVGIYT